MIGKKENKEENNIGKFFFFKKKMTTKNLNCAEVQTKHQFKTITII